MKVNRQLMEGVTIVSMAERMKVDAGNAEAFQDAVLAAAEDTEQMVLDISLVEFFDSAGLGALLSVQKQLAQRKGKLVLTGLNRTLRETFQMVGFDLLFMTFPDVPDSVASFKHGS